MKPNSVPDEKTAITGITGMQSESSVNDSTIEEGFTFGTQLDSKRENRSIKEEAASVQIKNIFFTQPLQTSKVTRIHIAIISVGGMVAVMVIAHVVLSIFHCANVNH